MSGGFKTYKWLLPASWLYGLGVRVRNLCFDKGLLQSRCFDIPVISVGNITVGGSGKTPHVEYLIHLLQSSFKVAVLSRGYKRATRGFVLADDSSTPRDIGDEPKQIKSKFGNVAEQSVFVVLDQTLGKGGWRYLTAEEVASLT